MDGSFFDGSQYQEMRARKWLNWNAPVNGEINGMDAEWLIENFYQKRYDEVSFGGIQE